MDGEAEVQRGEVTFSESPGPVSGPSPYPVDLALAEASVDPVQVAAGIQKHLHDGVFGAGSEVELLGQVGLAGGEPHNLAVQALGPTLSGLQVGFGAHVHVAVDHEEDKAQDDEELDKREEEEEVTQIIPAATRAAPCPGVGAPVLHCQAHLRLGLPAQCTDTTQLAGLL